jgi:hypothetical protein
MGDRFLDGLRQTPRPEFAESLRRRLAAQPVPDAPPRRSWGASPLVRAAAVVAVVGALMMVPDVRASARAFLGLFRVVNFVAVPVDEARAGAVSAAIASTGLDIPRLIGSQVQVLADGGPPTAVGSVELAASMAGMTVQQPTWQPNLTTLAGVQVMGERAVQVIANTAQMQSVLDALGIDDIEIPPAVNGQSAVVRVPPVVELWYQQELNDGRLGRRASLLQVRTPTVALPDGIELATFGEIGLRILGLEAGQARQLARRIDWHSTLLVPVPPRANSVRHVEIRGGQGLGIMFDELNILVWSQGDRVFAMRSSFTMDDTIRIAQSIE